MTTLSRLITTVICCYALATAQSQTAVSAKKGTKPVIKDWFLSTGNWQTDPQIYVCEFGTGRDTVLMLHGGWGGDHSGLITAVANLHDQFHFIFYDQRGSLRSPFPDSLISFDQHIEDVERLRKELKIEKLNLVGHSMGAVLASAYATKYPERIRKLVLLAPAGLKNPVPENEKDLVNKSNAAVNVFLNRPEVMRELEKYNLNRNTPPLSSGEETMKFRINVFKRMVFDVSKANDVMGGRALYKGHVFDLTARTYPASGWDYIKEFSNRTYPVSIITGDHDFLDFNNAMAKKWSTELPRMKLHVIKNAGHFIWLDQPDEFQKILARYLNSF